jgi:predicted nucleic acid-binding Zn ribbon protein
MKRNDFLPLKEVLKNVLNEERFKGKLDERKLIEHWSNIVGEIILKETKQIYIKNRKLFVKIDSPFAKNDLIYRRKELTKKLNTHVDASVIDDIIFL